MAWPHSIPPDLRAALSEVETGTPDDWWRVCVAWLGDHGVAAPAVAPDIVSRGFQNLTEYRVRIGPPEIYMTLREWLIVHQVETPSDLPVDRAPETRV